MSESPYEAFLTELAGFTHDPLGFVYWNYPWGEGELKGQSGPNYWQTEVLTYIGEELRAGRINAYQAIQVAIASGHGVGKSALIAMIIDWAQSTCEDTKGIVTANTENQLRTKTWVELAKWHRLGLTKILFKMTATSRFSVDPEHERTWRIDMIPWSEGNPEAFAGLHNKDKRILVVFDEGSAIVDIIWETISGALTDEGTEIIWLVAGNPTKSTGRFRECFPGGREAHRWKTFEVDSRNVPQTNKKTIAKWEADWGEDSDFFRVRVRGLFPRTSLTEFMSRDAIVAAMQRPAVTILSEPMILGVDVARFGDDASVIYPRKGRDARTFPFKMFRGLDTMSLAEQVVITARELAADAVFVDGTGVGGGVVDRCRQLGLMVFDINFGSRASRDLADGTRYADKRTEMWGNLRFALPGLSLPDDKDLLNELAAPEYSFAPSTRGVTIKLESKDSLRARGLSSPDIADALALTYAMPVVLASQLILPAAVGIDYDPYRPSDDYNPYRSVA